MNIPPVAAALATSLSDPVVVVDREGTVVCANPAAAALLRSTPQALTGVHLGAFLEESHESFAAKLRLWARTRQPVPGAIRLRNHMAARRVYCEAGALHVAGGEYTGHVLIHCRERSGSMERFEALNSKIRELAREIRERRNAEQALRESEERFRRLFEHASDAMLIADDRGVFIDANPAACSLFGRERSGLLGLSAFDIAAPQAQPAVGAMWREFEQAGAQAGSLMIARPGGEQREVEYSAARDFVAGQHLSILRDVTERRREERERQRQAEALARSNAELEQFAYVASHDLQEPLRTISSFLQLIGRRLAPLLDEETAGYLEMVREAVNRQRQIILDLLELSRLGRVERSNANVNLDQTLEQVLLYLRSSIAETGAEVRVDPLPVVQGDATQLYQLFLNLLHNAVKFPRGRPRVHVRAAGNEAEWIVTVADNGPGIEPRYFRSIFEPFRRLHGRDVPGSGIGLALCKRVVENHNGRIWVESVPGEGAAFHVALPVAAPDLNPGSAP